DVVAARLRRSTVAVLTGPGGAPGSGHGSGILWPAAGPDGATLVVTNAHVARDRSPTVVLADGRRAGARLLARDPRRDLALLGMDAPAPSPRDEDAPVPAVPGDPGTLRPGALVLALGHPLGVPNALTLGILHASLAPSSRGQRLTGRRMPLHDVATLHADVRLLPGNSGGPLADAAGRVVGVNTMVIGGMGVAVSVDEIAHLIDSIAPAPRLGVSVSEVRVRRDRGIHPALRVSTVDPGSPAARAGLLPGDLLLGHGGLPLGDGQTLRAVLRAAGPGGLVPLEVGRDGRRTVRVVRLDATSGSGAGAGGEGQGGARAAA
ncbi:MAG TPA: S1C family serine protease, partial [Gemmatirosa sp.]|nr:S1C family serine protease [Gemmatirosa sp.]